MVIRISEADREIHALSQRLNTNVHYVETVVRWQRKQQRALQQKSKQLMDCQFENDALKRENEFLRQQLLQITDTMASSHQQLQEMSVIDPLLGIIFWRNHFADCLQDTGADQQISGFFAVRGNVSDDPHRGLFDFVR